MTKTLRMGETDMGKHIIAVTPHPMWLIIKEDSVCLERTPPWGAPSIEEYSKRLDRNLSSLEKNPQARMGNASLDHALQNTIGVVICRKIPAPGMPFFRSPRDQTSFSHWARKNSRLQRSSDGNS